MVMIYLCERCQKNKTYLISPHEIAQVLSKKYILSVEEIDEIVVKLSNENLIDFVVSDSKNGYFYCINLKKAGQSFLSDIRRNRRTLGLLILRSCFLATVSFAFGLLLRTIFKN